MRMREFMRLVESAEPWPTVLKDRWEIARYIVSVSSGHVDEEFVSENFRGCRAVLQRVPVSSIKEGHADGNIKSKAKERRYAKMDLSTMPPLVIENGEIADGNHRFRVAVAAGATELLCYVVEENK